MAQQGKSQEEAQRQLRQLRETLDSILSFTAEEWEEIKRVLQEDPKLRRQSKQVVDKLREIIS